MNQSLVLFSCVCSWWLLACVSLTTRRVRVSMTSCFCSSSNCSHRHVSGIGMSLKCRFSCGMALLACPRSYWQVVGPAQESIGQAAKTQEVIQRADQLRILRTAGRTVEIGPLGGDQRLAAVRQDKHELQAGRHACL